MNHVKGLTSNPIPAKRACMSCPFILFTNITTHSFLTIQTGIQVEPLQSLLIRSSIRALREKEQHHPMMKANTYSFDTYYFI